jgi:hypothetical protein
VMLSRASIAVLGPSELLPQGLDDVDVC